MLAWRPFDVGVALSRLAFGRAASRAQARVIHATDPHRPWLPGKIRRIITVYDLIPLREPAVMASWRPHDRFFYRWYLKDILGSDSIVAISMATADDLVSLLGADRNRIHVVYPAVRQGLPVVRTASSEPTFLWVGALEVHKQPELAVRALAAYRAIHRAGRLRFIGPSSASERLTLLNLAQTLGVADYVSLEGRIPDEDLDLAFASAAALLATSRVEGFGLPAVEAVLRGIPVIAVQTAAALETLTGAATFTSSDPDAIAAAMISPRSPDADVVSVLRDRFSVRAAGEALWPVYEQLLA
jgi:glycosyltransferase involved in cell wall biosynthesis